MPKTPVSAAPFFTQGVNAAIAFGLVLFLALTTWVPDLPGSLGLDETLTFWVLKDGIEDVLVRSVHYQSQSAYYVLLWLWTQIFGTGEISLRLPSLLAALGACVALAKVGAALTRDRETGLLAMVVFATTWNVFRESIDARSYMPGLFVLVCLALFVVRWLDSGGWRDAWLCGALAALLPHFHLFLVLTYPAFVLYGALRWMRSRAQLSQLALVAMFLVAGATLYVPFARTLLANGSSYSFAPDPQWSSLFFVFTWSPPVAGLLVGICIAGVIGLVRYEDEKVIGGSASPISREVGVLLTIWMLSPLLILFTVSMLTDISLFLGRYLISAIPAVCLLYAIALRDIPSAPARVIAVVIIALASFMTHVRPADDFRGAVASVNQFVAGDASIPVLLSTGLIEAQDETWLRDPERADYLEGPTSYYPIDGRVVMLPRALHGQRVGHEIVTPVLRESRRFAAIEWATNGSNIMSWLIPSAEAAGYRVDRRAVDGVRIAYFTFQGNRRSD